MLWKVTGFPASPLAAITPSIIRVTPGSKYKSEPDSINNVSSSARVKSWVITTDSSLVTFRFPVDVPARNSRINGNAPISTIVLSISYVDAGLPESIQGLVICRPKSPLPASIKSGLPLIFPVPVYPPSISEYVIVGAPYVAAVLFQRMEFTAETVPDELSYIPVALS